MNPLALSNLTDLRFHLHQIRVNQEYWKDANIEELQREQDICYSLCRFVFEELGIEKHEILTSLESFRDWALSTDSIRDIDRWEHKLNAEQQHEIVSSYISEKNSDKLKNPLTDNDRNILQSMWETRVTLSNPKNGREIVKKALGGGDEKKAFKNLMLHELVESKTGRHGGYWLTENGEKVASSLNS